MATKATIYSDTQPRAVAPRATLPLRSLIAIGVWTGLLGAFVVILWSGSSAVMAGLLVGVICGFLAPGKATIETPREGARTALIAALVAGGLILAGQLFRYYGLEVPQYVRSGRVENLGVALRAVALGIALAAGISTLLGYAHYLPARQSRVVTVTTLAVLIILFPFIDQAIRLLWTNTLIPILVFTLLALGLNIVVGYAGLLDLGYAAFFAIGAYTAGLLSSSHLGGQFGYSYQMNFWLVIWIAAAVAALFGLLLGAPTLPLRGDYLAIVTLGFGEIVPIVFRNLTSVTISVPFTDTVLIGKGGIWADLPKGFNITNGEFGINPIQQPQLQIVDLSKVLTGSLATEQMIGALLGLLVYIVIVVVAFIFVLRTLELQRINNAPIYARAGTGVAMAVGVGILSFIFFGQYYTWWATSVLTVAAAIMALLLARNERSIMAGMIAFAAGLGIATGIFIAASYIDHKLSFSNPNDRWMWYYLIIGLMLLSAFLISRLRRSRLGRAWMAMREDELAAAAMGIDIVRTKLLAFSMGATFSGFAGVYFASYIQGIFPSTFDFSVSVIVLCMVILGGLGNMVGVVVGGLIIMSADRLFLPQISSFVQDLTGTTGNDFFANFDISQYRIALFGLVLVVMMQVRPGGLMPSARRKAELTKE